LFSEGVARKGLDGRERQILLAIVAWSGLERSHDIFITPDAFDQGAAKLLEECASRRTRQESERLQAEVTGLRGKLAYRVIGKHGQTTRSHSPGIPVGATVELLRRASPEGPVLAAVVLRNDDLEIAVETPTPPASATGEAWRVRYRLGADVWQSDAFTVSCEDRKLVLTKAGQVRAADRDRPVPMIVHPPAAVARFPFIQAATIQLEDVVPTDWFELVRGVVTRVSDSSLEIRSPLQVQVGERILVVFALAPATAGEATNGAEHRGHIIGHVGRVEHRETAGEETVITVDLTDLPDREIAELMRLARAAASSAGGSAGARIMQRA
jgi:hypothetical protein